MQMRRHLMYWNFVLDQAVDISIMKEDSSCFTYLATFSNESYGYGFQYMEV